MHFTILWFGVNTQQILTLLNWLVSFSMSYVICQYWHIANPTPKFHQCLTPYHCWLVCPAPYTQDTLTLVLENVHGEEMLPSMKSCKCNQGDLWFSIKWHSFYILTLHKGKYKCAVNTKLWNFPHKQFLIISKCQDSEEHTFWWNFSLGDA